MNCRAALVQMFAGSILQYQSNLPTISLTKELHFAYRERQIFLVDQAADVDLYLVASSSLLDCWLSVKWRHSFLAS